MHDIMRKRLMRKLETLPEEQLYQVLDYIEFLESRYAMTRSAEPAGLQRFAERLEDRMRIRSLAPKAVSGTMKVIGTAGRVWDNLAGAGQGILHGLESGFELIREESRESGGRDLEDRKSRVGASEETTVRRPRGEGRDPAGNDPDPADEEGATG